MPYDVDMPELPEVESVVRAFRDHIIGRTIAEFECRWPRQAAPDAQTVRVGLCGRRVTGLSRRAKWLVASLDDGAAMLLHLRMSGRLEWANGCEPPHVRAVWRFTDGARLLFCDARKFGRIVYAPDPDAATRGLGIEPLSDDFTSGALKAILRRRARQLKPLLLDQAVVAGLGNIYVDEALHRAGLHPLLRSDRIPTPRIARLRNAIRAVLRQAIRLNGTSFDWVYGGGAMQSRLRVYGREGLPCRTCGTPIIALRVGQRGTHLCPSCQPRRCRP